VVWVGDGCACTREGRGRVTKCVGEQVCVFLECAAGVVWVGGGCVAVQVAAGVVWMGGGCVVVQAVGLAEER
jgi:hypothetical protein